MTSAEIAEQLGVSENYIRKHFSKVREGLRRKGLLLTKLGRGAAANYRLNKIDDVILKKE
jgi:DNA-binding IscR family transcriptional regulator